MPTPETTEAIERRARDICEQFGCEPDAVLAINPSNDGATSADIAVPAWLHFREQAERELADER